VKTEQAWHDLYPVVDDLEIFNCEICLVSSTKTGQLQNYAGEGLRATATSKGTHPTPGQNSITHPCSAVLLHGFFKS
jgi:hypothetical protein